MGRFTLLTIMLLLAACTPATPPPDATPPAATPPVTPPPDATPPATAPETTIIQANLPRLVAPPVDETYIRQLAQENNAFAFDLYHATRDNSDDNLIYSPYSISLAFSMVYAGARGQTEAEMAQALRFLSPDIHHLAFNALDQHLAALAESDNEEDGRFQLNIANAVWGQIGTPFEEAYLAMLAQQYGAGLRASDFIQRPQETTDEINEWVAEQTEERIPDILPPGVINPLTRLVLVNAIYFKAAWLFPFAESATQDGFFTLLDGSQVTAPFMQQSGLRILYAEGPEYQAVILPYARQDVQMVVILPQAGHFETVEAALSADFLNQVRSQVQLRDVRLTMPRFDFETELDLKKLLTGMGLHDPFSDTADFSGIVADDDLLITDALHKGTITVNEEGTEAAAATAIIAGVTSMVESAEVTMDRPFILAITEQETGAILFLGRVMNPSASN